MAYKKDAYGSPSGEHLTARKYTARTAKRKDLADRIGKAGEGSKRSMR